MANPKILVSLLDEGQEYQHGQAQAARAAGSRAGVDVEIVWCSDDPGRQVAQLTQALQSPDRRPAAVVLHPVAVAGLEALARSALSAGVGWISLDQATYLESLQREFPSRLVALVAPDNREMGRLQARLFRTLLPAGGEVVYVEGPSLGPAVVGRREGMKQGIAGSGVTVLHTLTGGWTEAGAERAMSFWLRVGGKAAHPALVGAQNDQMAMGARKAVRALRPDWADVLFTGCDGLPEGGLRHVREGALAGTVIQPMTAGTSVELAARFLRGEQVPATTVLPPQLHPSEAELRQRART